MAVLILAGPPAVGHNAIGELVCERRDRAALIDVDAVRYMQRVPYASPWEGAEGERQYQLGIRNACALACRFDADGSDVVLLDLAPPETLPLYRAELSSVEHLVTVLLHAEGDELVARDVARARATGLEASFWHGRIRSLRDELLADAACYDHVHDTETMSAEESADRLAPLLAGEGACRDRAMTPKDGITIRAWEGRDREDVRSLLRHLSQDAEVRSENAPTYVAESGERVVGMVTLCVFRTLTGPKAYLDHLVVAPGSRRRGIGSALVRHAIERAAASGVSRIDVTANQEKQAGRALYRSLGFQARDTGSFRLYLAAGNPAERS